MFIFNQKKGRAVRRVNMPEAKELLQRDQSICLVDVRTAQEYHEGHIPGSVNVPLDRLGGISSFAPELDKKLFVYCLSGGRSARACAQLASMGYTDISDLGGIVGWTGKLERKGTA